MDFISDSSALLPDLVALRRELHQIPELGRELPKTQQRVLDALDGLDLEITLGERTTSIAAALRGGKPAPVVLLRADMDALPIVESTELDFASTNGAMHACGHDLYAAGRTLSQDAVDAMIARTRELAEGIAAAHGCRADVTFTVQSPATINDDAEADRPLNTLGTLFGADRAITLPQPGMASEDFSFVLQEVPGAFLTLQCSPPGTDVRTAA